MTWRVSLPYPMIQHVDMLSAESTVVVVWTQTDRVHYFDQRNGTPLGERVIETVATTDRRDARWRAFVNSLVAPNKLFLPFVRLPAFTLFTTTDGKVRLYVPPTGTYSLETDDQESPLTTENITRFAALHMDQQVGVIVGIDNESNLHVYRQRLYVGSSATGLEVTGERNARVWAVQGGKLLVASDSQRLMTFDGTGKLLKRLDLHYPLGEMAVSVDGRWIATSDAETGVVRIYEGQTLVPTFQRYAIDLAADTRRRNLAAGAPPPTVVPGGMAITNRGVLAFALGALLCVTSTSRMRGVPASTSG